MFDIDRLEQERLRLQARLDGEKTQAERNRLGQFATPTALARDILEYAKKILGGKAPVRFLDPAIGTGSFYSAFLHVFGQHATAHATGFEIDDHYGAASSNLWREHDIEIRHEDFTRAPFPADEASKADLIVCNPPYVRHHHLDGAEKKRLHDEVLVRHGVALSGLSGLYCYFLCLSKGWMARSGLAAWLIPGEFMDVNYGRAVKDFLLDKVTLLSVHRFLPDDVQFGDALVSSSVVWFKNEEPPNGHRVRFTLGGGLSAPKEEGDCTVEELRRQSKWMGFPKARQTSGTGRRPPVVGDFFEVKRGVATGANEFFVLSPHVAERLSIPSEFLNPILPSPRYLKADCIESDKGGFPLVERAGYLFSSDIPEERIQAEFPAVWRYLKEGEVREIPGRYICRNRSPWYCQEKRGVAPILCTYMGRAGEERNARPFRFILNRSRAIAANVYLMLYPKPWLKRELRDNPRKIEEIWQALQNIPMRDLVGEGRVYGGGLHKLEPRELLNAPAVNLDSILSLRRPGRAVQHMLF